MATMTFPADLESLASCLAFVTAYATAAGIPPKRVGQIELAVEEAFANICKYAYAQSPGQVEVRCTHDEQGLRIELADTGQPFNPLTYTPPDKPDDMMQWSLGKEGIRLIREMMDQVAYRREGEWNIFQLTVQMVH